MPLACKPQLTLTVLLNHSIISDFSTETAQDSSVFSLIFNSLICFSPARGYAFLLHLKAPKAPSGFSFIHSTFLECLICINLSQTFLFRVLLLWWEVRINKYTNNCVSFKSEYQRRSIYLAQMEESGKFPSDSDL